MTNRIKISKDGEHYYTADPTWLPGSPICGQGRTPLHALMNLFAWSGDFDLEIEDETGESCPKTKCFDIDGRCGVLYDCSICGGEPFVDTTSAGGRSIVCKCGNKTDVFRDQSGENWAVKNAADQWNGEGYIERFRD